MNLELVQRYIEGDLTPEELKSFEEELAQNEGLQIEVKLQREMISYEANDDLNKSISVLQAVHESYDNSTTETTKRIWPIVVLAIAASLALFFIIRINNNQLSPDQLYAQNLNIPVASFMTKGDDIEDHLQSGEIHFNSENYEEALFSFQSYLTKDGVDNEEVRFYIALCRLGMKELDEARKDLIALSNKSDLFRTDCTWYLALIEIKTKNFSEAIDYLSSLNNSGYKERAEKLKQDVVQLQKNRE